MEHLIHKGNIISFDILFIINQGLGLEITCLFLECGDIIDFCLKNFIFLSLKAIILLSCKKKSFYI